jgi:thiamine-monophosphate kinase
VCVTGDLGRSFAGLKILMRERRMMLDAFQENPDLKPEAYKPDFSEFEKVIEKHLLPKARTDIIEFFRKEKITPTAMIDVSDGLGSELKHICRNSAAGGLIEESKLPILSETRESADEFEDDATTYALFGGEDYELLFTVSPKDAAKLEKNPDIHIIGKITDDADGVKMTDLFGAEVNLFNHSGFQHFSQEETSEFDTDHDGHDHDDHDGHDPDGHNHAH